MALPHARTKRWTADEVERAFETGTFPRDARIELIDGEIVEMAAHNPPHSRAIMNTTSCLVRAFDATHRVGCQLPFRIGVHDQPEPDFVVVSLPEFRRSAGQPITQADLVVEVADTSLAYDRDEKASLYARAGVLDYWILNVRERQLEVHRDPVPMPDRLFGCGYASVKVLSETDAVTPLVLPEASILVGDLLG